MPLVPVSPLILPLIQPAAYARNGMVVPTVAVQAAAHGANQVLRLRTKELYSSPGLVESLMTASAGTNTQYRAFVHTGPNVSQIRYFVTVARCAASDTGDPYVTVATTTTGGVAIDSTTIHIGQNNSVTDCPDEWHEYTGILDVNDNDYNMITFSTTDHARIVHAMAIESMTKADTIAAALTDGYANGAPIYDADRAAMQAALDLKWRRGAAHILNWHATSARTTTSATATNVIDNSSTTVTASTPGVTLDMRYKARLGLASTGVTCIIAAYGSIAAGSNGQLLMKDSSGTTLATVGLFSTTPAWVSVTVVLPATKAKYDFQFKTAASTFTLNDISIFEREP